MASIIRLPCGSRPVQVRRKGRYVSETFRLRKGAEEWARATESRIDLHVADMAGVGKASRRTDPRPQNRTDPNEKNPAGSGRARPEGLADEGVEIQRAEDRREKASIPDRTRQLVAAGRRRLKQK